MDQQPRFRPFVPENVQMREFTARERIRTMVDSTDGFYIAEMDLKLRGPGEFFGTRQSGLPTLRIGNIIRDHDVLEVARGESQAFIANPPTPEDLAAR